MGKFILDSTSCINLFDDITENEQIKKLVFSKSLDKFVVKKQGKLFISNGEIFLQIEKICIDNKVYHENIKKDDIKDTLLSILINEFKQCNIFTNVNEYQIIRKNNEFVCIRNKIKNQVENVQIESHNHEKNYIFKENVYVDFLYELSIMTKDGKIISKQYDKFRQINKYLEFVKNTLSALKGNKDVKIVDFCCGKGYLTFATYVYLTKACGLNVTCIGVDIKSDVVNKCNEIAKKLNMKDLKFICCDINEYNDLSKTDIIISLHACNTLTDIVLGKAIKNNVKIILSSPCCHNELSTQYDNADFKFITKYPIFKERLCEIITDSIRCKILESYGYKVSVSEFVSLENTGKNVLIDAQLKGNEVKISNENMIHLNKLCSDYSYKSTLLTYLSE